MALELLEGIFGRRLPDCGERQWWTVARDKRLCRKIGNDMTSVAYFPVHPNRWRSRGGSALFARKAVTYRRLWRQIGFAPDTYAARETRAASIPSRAFHNAVAAFSAAASARCPAAGLSSTILSN